MDAQLDTIQTLISINRKALRELAKVAETTSADYLHIDTAMKLIGDQFHLLLQQKEEMMAKDEEVVPAEQEPQGMAQGTLAAATTQKRGRGAEKEFYLRDENLKPAFIAQLKRIFQRHYTAAKTFTLPDGTEAKAPDFLACLYDIGIKYGVASPEAPVYNMSCLLKEAARDCPNAQNFTTAYNTLQTTVRKWKHFTGNEARYYCVNVRFHKLKPEDVPSDYKDEYHRVLLIYTQVEQIFKETCTEVLFSGGLPHSSVEMSVMDMERRG